MVTSFVMNYFPDEVLEHVFDCLTSQRDRNSVSLVCTLWFKVERYSRARVFIGNCYVTSPQRVVGRFPRLKSLILKGKPHFADFNLVPNDWGGFVQPWIEALAKTCPGLEELRLKRMVVSDDGLDLLSRSFVKFKSLVLVCCEGFTTDGLAAIAANCRFLRELDLQENEVEDYRGQWLSCFPQGCTSLVSLNFSCLKGEVNLIHLERLVARCSDLRRLRLNCVLPYETLRKILVYAPQLEDLGIGGFAAHEHSNNLNIALQDSKCITSLSGFSEAVPQCLPAFYMICPGLTSLNLSYATGISGTELTKMICLCTKLQRLWVLDRIGDLGLEAVACRCKELEELRVFPFDMYGDADSGVTEKGLVGISQSCPKLSSLLYFCQQMTNAGLKTVARNCSGMTRFRLCILDPTKPDPETLQPLDEGFGAVVQWCKGVRRLSISGLLTDQVFRYIGAFGKEVKMLSVAFAGNSDKGMVWLLNGCEKLRKLEVRDSCFGDTGLLANMGKYETMRSLWMSGCDITYGGCRKVAKNMPMLNVEILKEKGKKADDGDDDDDVRVDKMFLYRTLVAGQREDAPPHILTL